MNPFKLKALEGILNHIAGLQGGDLKDLMMKKEMDETPSDEAKEGPLEQALEDKPENEMGKPKGIAIEKVSIMGKKPGMDSDVEDVAKGSEPDHDSDMSDDELAELYNKFRR